MVGVPVRGGWVVVHRLFSVRGRGNIAGECRRCRQLLCVPLSRNLTNGDTLWSGQFGGKLQFFRGFFVGWVESSRPLSSLVPKLCLGTQGREAPLRVQTPRRSRA